MMTAGRYAIAIIKSPAQHSLEGWTRLIPQLVLLTGDRAATFAGAGPLITDDRPRPEYFILRHAFGSPSPPLSAKEISLNEILPWRARLHVDGPSEE